MLPALTVVAKIAPKEMKAPPRTLSTSNVSGSIDARLTPLSSARSAMAAGMIASKRNGLRRRSDRARLMTFDPVALFDHVPLNAIGRRQLAPVATMIPMI